MASSLDDMEPYEVFQQELDERLKNYQQYLSIAYPTQNNSKIISLINHFIEYTCFVKSFSSMNEINNIDTIGDFYYVYKDNDYTLEQAIEILLDFLNPN